MTYLIIKILHIFSVLIYGGFLFTDNLILMRMQKTLSKEKYDEVRSYFKEFTRVLVPKALVVAVISGILLFQNSFGSVGENGFSNFQILLSIKGILGLWLGAEVFSRFFLEYSLLFLKATNYHLF